MTPSGNRKNKQFPVRKVQFQSHPVNKMSPNISTHPLDPHGPDDPQSPSFPDIRSPVRINCSWADSSALIFSRLNSFGAFPQPWLRNRSLTLQLGLDFLKTLRGFGKRKKNKTKQKTLWLIFHTFNEMQQNISNGYEDGNLQELRNCWQSTCNCQLSIISLTSRCWKVCAGTSGSSLVILFFNLSALCLSNSSAGTANRMHSDDGKWIWICTKHILWERRSLFRVPGTLLGIV